MFDANLEKPRNQFRVLTLNLRQRYGNWEERRSVIVDGLRTLQPDILGIAESVKNDGDDQVADLLGEGFSVAHSNTRDSNGMGISIARRWPLGEIHEVDLRISQRTAGFPCTSIVAEVIAPEPIRPFQFVNHFPNWQLDLEYERELQAVAVAKFGEKRSSTRNQQVVMVGDLDADPESASIRFWCGRQSLYGISVCYRDAWESRHDKSAGQTFTPENPTVTDEVVKSMRPFRDWPFRRIDYIFLRFGAHGGNAFDIISCERIFDRPMQGVWASDHFGLTADLAQPSAKP